MWAVAVRVEIWLGAGRLSYRQCWWWWWISFSFISFRAFWRGGEEPWPGRVSRAGSCFFFRPVFFRDLTPATPSDGTCVVLHTSGGSTTTTTTSRSYLSCVCVCLACLFWQTLTSSFDSLKSAECAGVWRRRRPKKRNVETVSRCGDWNCVDGRDSCVNGTTSQQGNQEGVHNTFCVLRRRSFHALGPRSFVQQFLQYYPTRRCVSSSFFLDSSVSFCLQVQMFGSGVVCWPSTVESSLFHDADGILRFLFLLDIRPKMLRIPRGESCQGRCIHILAPLKLFRVISRVNQFETARIADGYLSREKNWSIRRV